MKTLKICYIRDEYINFLLQYDCKVPYNKSQTRPYVGVVYSFNNSCYFAPLSSPKPKHLKMNAKNIDIFKINQGIWGIININNMIPTPVECLVEVLPQIKDKKYRELIINQTTFINDHKKELFAKTKNFMREYVKGHLPDKVVKRCCNFDLLEEKCKEWELENTKGHFNQYRMGIIANE